MNCADIDKDIDGFFDNQLSPLRIQAFEQHVSRCADCDTKLEHERELRSLLSSLPVPQPSTGFKARLFSEVRSHYPEERQHHTGFRLASGLASIAVFSLSLWFFYGAQEVDPRNQYPQIVTVATNTEQPVRLMFDANEEIDQAQLSVDLPDNVRLAGYPGRNHLTWNTSLHKGQNVLALPVVASESGKAELRTQIIYKDKVKSFNFILDAKSNAQHVDSVEIDDTTKNF